MFFKWPHRQKSMQDSSSDCGNQGTGPPCAIISSIQIMPDITAKLWRYSIMLEPDTSPDTLRYNSQQMEQDLLQEDEVCQGVPSDEVGCTA